MSSPTLNSSTQPSVLLVEDEKSIAAPFAAALARGGFRPSVAHTGAEAVEMASELDPDIVLLDLSLPDIDGRDLCRQLRLDSDVPIIMVTASGTVTDRVVGLELGADDYVVKPFATGEVISAEELGGADTHGRRSGVVDHVAADDEDGIELIDAAAPFDAMVPIAGVVPPVVAAGIDDIWEPPPSADPIVAISAAPPAALVAAPAEDIDDIEGA